MAESPMSTPVSSQVDNRSDKYRALAEKIGSELRAAAPGIITAYDPGKQTATVQLAIRERLRQPDGSALDTQLPLLLDCPVMMPRGGGFVLTLPVAVGDECLVVFADACIDAWWFSGGVQNQMERRRHDLSDGIVIPGLWSQPRKLPTHALDGAYLMREDGSMGVAVTADGVMLKADGSEVKLTAESAMIQTAGSTVEASADSIALIAAGSTVQIEAGRIALNAESVTVNGKEVRTV